ncbi:Outer membrane vitamin B12 receptor BtuB [hydrothermal vent metagenome]|uniref:Outer membrane vitamin B12 receptor BtuB n=1 Tax=hydrothermal vent metagenome TaxID=652676 RepID=A0A3B0UZP1_9ZZZZ
MKPANLLPISAALLLTANLNAATQTETYKQPDLVVTASRYEQSKDDIIPSVTIIDREDILNLQASNILDLLSLQQGIDVARTGGSGSATSVFMRGTNSNHTLVLIDGMRVGSAFTGSFTWEHLPVSQIQRIEIVRGTRVSYYGSDAIGGVINIITRKQDKLYVRYTTGSFDTQNFDIGFGNTTETGHYSLILGSQKTDGFSATNANNAFAFNPDNDGYENQSINFNSANNFQHGKLKINHLQTHGDTDFDTGNSDSKERVTRIVWQNEIFNAWQSEFALGSNYNQLNTKAFNSNFSSQRYSFDWLLNKQVNNGHLAYGLTYRKETAEFFNPHANEVSFADNRNNIAVFANWQGIFAQNIFSTSARFDNNSVYGSNISADIDWAYSFTDIIRFNLSAGSAFHAPSINELFSPNFQGMVISPITGENVFVFAFEGNPDLKPEESINYEAGLKTKISDNQDISFNMFYYSIDNLIDFQGPTFKPININQATIKGLEASYNYALDNLSFNINTTIQDTNNDATDTPLLRRPDNKLNISVDKFFNKLSIGSSLRYASGSQDFGGKLDSYIVLDVRASYQINNHWQLAIKLENITDEQYQIVNGYNTPNTSGYLTIQWQQ